MSAKSTKKNHHAHVIIPEDVWQKLVKLAGKREPKESVTALLIEGAQFIIQRDS